VARLAGYPQHPADPSRGPQRVPTVRGDMTPPRPKPSTTSRLERLVERAMTFAVEEYDDDRAVRRLAWLAQDDHAALDQACDLCLSHIEVDLAIRGRAIGLLARVRYDDLQRSCG
jgi:hypothetical protein